MKAEHIVKVINRMVSNLLKVAIICVLLVGVSGCSADISTKDTPTKRHLFSYMQWNEEKMLVGFNEEQENRILEAFNVVIPENEEEAYVYSFYFSEDDDHLNFTLEIDGVKDYNAFFQANSGRIKENGLSGKSSNEIFKRYLPMESYYVTYDESFYSKTKLQSDEDKEMISILSTLYDELKEEKNNHS
ncbi:MAG: hypothetical protein J1F28_03505 [Oscillospiraceae bacterium]|nr:hypothetical protein [Oscillospiraceae bacterium]